MALPRPPQPVKLIAGLLAASGELLNDARGVLDRRYGAIDAVSTPALWRVSNYYDDEMGPAISRQFVSFAALIEPGRLAAIKVETNELEDTWRFDGKRKVNIDPGYVGLTKLVLATTKDAAHRIYLADGIYAEPTLRYENATFQPYAHTYRDYAGGGAPAFFNAVRALYLTQIKAIAREG